ncbi:MAG: HAD hydrolase family protein [Minicystis sp.]
MSPTLAPRRLLALDLDGTLVRDDGTIDARDRAAIARARRAGAAVTLATGRLSPATLRIARALDLDTPLVCADGAVLVCPRTGRVLDRIALAEEALAALLDALAAHDLAPFVCFPDAVFGDESGLPHLACISGWSTAVEVHPVIAPALDGRACEVVMALGLGPRDRVEAALAVASAALGPAAALATFGLGEGAPWALRAQPPGVDKGTALARLAAHLGVARADVAAVGDWYNDLSMLSWAGQSFAMGQSPPAVRAAAREVLTATAAKGGGIAEAVNRWLGG